MLARLTRHLLSTAAKQHRLVLLIDEAGKPQGRQELGSVVYDKAKYDLLCVQDDASLPVYRLQSKGLAYRKAREAHAAAVEQRRASRLKQVRFTLRMSPHDHQVHLDRVRDFVGKHGWRVRCILDLGRHNPDKKAGEQRAHEIVAALRDVAHLETPPAPDDSHQVSFWLRKK